MARIVRVRLDGGDEFWDPDLSDIDLHDAGSVPRWVAIAPGVLTSLGLTVTFIALAIGLSGLQVDKSDQNLIKGVDDLIPALAGKFVASICGLVSSIIVLLADSLYARPKIAAARSTLVKALAAVVPVLSTQHLLAFLHVEALKQSRSLSNISTDVVQKFAQVFRDDLSEQFSRGFSGALVQQMEPILNDVRTSMEGLQQTVARLEEQKSESVVGQLRELTTSIEQALTTTLGQMGEQFRAALSGSAQAEFDGLAGVVRDSATNLQATNEVFRKLEASLTLLVDQSRSTTSDQLHAGQQQSERLNSLVENLVNRLNEQATRSGEQASEQLLGVVSLLADRMRRLTEGLGEDIARLTRESQASAHEGLENARAVTATTAAQLRDLLQGMDTRLEGINEAGAALQGARDAVEQTLTRNSDALGSMQRAANSVQAYSADLGTLQRSVLDGQRLQGELASRGHEQLVRFEEIGRQQAAVAQHYGKLLSEYETAFGEVDERLRPVLETINDGLRRYLDAIQGNFKTIVEKTNELLPKSIDRIHDATNALKDELDSLTEVIEQTGRRLRPEVDR